MDKTPRSQLLAAAGYLTIFAMPTLLVVGAVTGHAFLALGTAFLVFPLMRLVFGAYKPVHELPWREGIASMLHALPAAYALFMVGSLLVVAHQLPDVAESGAPELVGMGLSLWITMLFALCPAHELIHRRSRFERDVGSALAGAIGYPALLLEHSLHHARHGQVELAEWPGMTESAWTFAIRRLRRVAADDVNDMRRAASSWRTSASARHTVIAHATMVAVATYFLAVAGPAGALLYLCSAAGCAFGMQLITYVQHWGLGDDAVVAGRDQPLAWEDDCRFQAWVTCHISFHQQHHWNAHTAYYRLGMAAGAPRLPAGYIVMLLLCLVPALWREAMLPVLAHWHDDPNDVPTPGRRLTCWSDHARASGVKG